VDGAAKRVGGSSDGNACDAVAGPARRQRGASIGNASGKGTLTGLPARTPGWWPVCRQQWERGGSVRVAACGQSVTSPYRGATCRSRAARIAILRAQGCGVREVPRRIGRAPSTISRELHRNAATRAPRHWNCPGTHLGFD
jgi:Helix-turn-helix domain